MSRKRRNRAKTQGVMESIAAEIAVLFERAFFGAPTFLERASSPIAVS